MPGPGARPATATPWRDPARRDSLGRVATTQVDVTDRDPPLMSTTILAALLCCAASLPGQVVQDRELVTRQVDAMKILERMREVYATCSTYRDKGKVETVFVNDRGTRNVVKNFETAYVLP